MIIHILMATIIITMIMITATTIRTRATITATGRTDIIITTTAIPTNSTS